MSQECLRSRRHSFSVTIAPSAKGFGSKLNSDVGSGVRASGSSLGKTFGKLFVLGAGVIAAAGIGNLLKGSIDEAREAQKVGAQTGAVLKSTGGIANQSAAQIGRLSSALSAKIGVDDEAIQAGQNMLLTFTNVRNEAGRGNDIFKQATRTVQDMAAAFGGDATSNSKILGKALNDPTKGVSALTRVGVTFTDKQKEQIKTFQESGNILGAQKIILRELGKETKGSAEAQATAGDKARVALGNLKETIGTALLPVIDRMANIFTTTVAPAITTFVGQLQSGEGAGGRVASIFQTVGSVLATVGGLIVRFREPLGAFVVGLAAWAAITKVVAISQGILNAVLAANPVGIIIIAIAALVAGLVYAYRNSEKFRAAVDVLFSVMKKGFSVVAKAFGVMFGFIKDHWRLIITILGGPIGLAVALITKHWDKIKLGAQVVVAWVKDNWPAIKAVITAPFEAAKTVIGKVWTALRQGASRVKEVVTKVFKAISDAIQGAIDKVQTLIDKLASVKGGGAHGRVGQLGGDSKDAGRVLGRGLADGAAEGVDTRDDVLANAAGNVVDKMTKAVKAKLGKLREALAGVRSDFASLVEPIASNFTSGLFDFDSAGAFTANLTTVKGTLTTLLGNFKTLIADGLSPGFLYQLFQSGGPGLIAGLAGLPKADALAAGSLFGEVTSLSTQLGTAVAGATDKGAALENQTVRLEKKLDHLIKAVHDSGDKTREAVTTPAKHARRRAVRA